MKLRLSSVTASILGLVLGAASDPARAAEPIDEILAGGQLQQAYNPVLLNFLLGEGKDTLPEAQRKQAIDQLVTALKANLQITEGAKTTAEIADLAGELLGGEAGRAIRGGIYDIWDDWVDSADVLLAAGYKEEALAFYESCAKRYGASGGTRTRCILGLAKAQPDKAFDIVMLMAQSTVNREKDVGLRSIGHLAAHPTCTEEQKVAILERLVKSTEGMDKAAHGEAAVQGLIDMKDERAIERLTKIASGGAFSLASDEAIYLAQRGLLLTYDDRTMVERIQKKLKGGMLSTNTPSDKYWAARTLIQADDNKGWEWATKTLKQKKPGGMFSMKKGEKDYFGETLWFLVGLGGDKANAAFSEALDKGKGKDKRKALLAIALARIGDTSGMDRVKQALEKEKWGAAYRWQAAVALAQHGDYSGIPVLQYLATSKKNKKQKIYPEDTRPDVAWALGHIDHADGVPILTGLLDDEHEGTRRAAVYALRRMNDAAALDGLLQALDADYGENVEKRSFNPQFHANIVRRAVVRFPEEERAKAVVEKGTESDYLSVRFLSLLAQARLGG